MLVIISAGHIPSSAIALGGGAHLSGGGSCHFLLSLHASCCARKGPPNRDALVKGMQVQAAGLRVAGRSIQCHSRR